MFPSPNGNMNQPNRRPTAPTFNPNQPGAPNQNGQAPPPLQNRYQSGAMTPPMQGADAPGGGMVGMSEQQPTAGAMAAPGGTPPWGSGSASTGAMGTPGASGRPQYQGAPPPVARQQMVAPQAYQRQAMSQQVPQQRKLTPPSPQQ